MLPALLSVAAPSVSVAPFRTLTVPELTSVPESVALTATSRLPPAELMAEPPLKMVMSMVVPPLWMKSLPPPESGAHVDAMGADDLRAAASDGYAAGNPAGKDCQLRELRAPSSVPPARTVSVPPLKMVVGSATPPEDTRRTPPLDTLVSLATPPPD